MDAHIVISVITGVITMLVGLIIKAALTGAKSDLISHQTRMKEELVARQQITETKLAVHAAEDEGQFRAQREAAVRQDAVLLRQDATLARIEAKIGAKL